MYFTYTYITAPARWPGQTRLNKHKKIIWNSMDKQLSCLDKGSIIVLCTRFPIWQTTLI